MSKIIDRAKEWSDSRGISKQKPSVEGFVANVTLELSEYLIGCKDNDSYEMIDGVADIAVFSITEHFKYGETPSNIVTSMLSKEHTELTLWKESSPHEFNLKIIKLLSHYASSSRYDMAFALDEIIIACFVKMELMGYKVALVMNEVLKVVESRIGEWNYDTNKFEKHTTMAAMALWYDADYENAKL